MFEVFALLVLFQIKHFVCDYPLQTKAMLGKMNRTGWVWPLITHVNVHALGTYLLVVTFTLITGMEFIAAITLAYIIAMADFVLHFIIDRIKASPNLLGRFKPDQPYFWWALGADQMAHHLINYVFIYIIITW
jgi:hypothetical protein